jgi:hypothetical protein
MPAANVARNLTSVNRARNLDVRERHGWSNWILPGSSAAGVVEVMALIKNTVAICRARSYSARR